MTLKEFRERTKDLPENTILQLGDEAYGDGQITSFIQVTALEYSEDIYFSGAHTKFCTLYIK